MTAGAGPLRVAVVGSGPAGLYTAEALVKRAGARGGARWAAPARPGSTRGGGW